MGENQGSTDQLISQCRVDIQREADVDGGIEFGCAGFLEKRSGFFEGVFLVFFNKFCSSNVLLTFFHLSLPPSYLSSTTIPI